jgi:hypothetical protein
MQCWIAYRRLSGCVTVRGAATPTDAEAAMAAAAVAATAIGASVRRIKAAKTTVK